MGSLGSDFGSNYESPKLPDSSPQTMIFMNISFKFRFTFSQ